MFRPSVAVGILIALSGLLPLGLYALAGSSLPVAPAPVLQPVPPLEQAALFLAVYAIKLTYMALAAGLILLLWKLPRLAALTWGLIFFEFGEICCGLNILFFFEESPLLEYLHSWGMVVCLGFLAFAALEALDHSLLHFSDPTGRCALLGICLGCAKHKDAPCALRRLYLGMIPMLGLLALMPLNAQAQAASYNALIFGFLRNLSHPIVVQVYEIRFCPLASLLLLVLAWVFLALWKRPQEGLLKTSKILLAAALGHLGFAFMRLAFFGFYRPNLVWFLFWEELTELLLIAGLIYAVWLLRPDAPRRLKAFLA